MSRGREGVLFWGVLALYVTFRVAQILGATASFDDEDGWTLAAAWELLHGKAWPYQAYQLSDWECGTRLAVWLAVPFTWLFGPSLLAIKLTGLTISTVTLAGVYLVCRRCFGLTAALLGALLYILFPAPIYTYSVTAHGFHPDSMAILIFLFWLGAGFHGGHRAKGRMFLIGLLGGFAIFFAYISVIGVFAALAPLLWMAFRRRGAARAALPALALGLGLGAAPLLLYNLLNDFSGIATYHGDMGQYFVPQQVGEKVAWFQQHTSRFLVQFTDLARHTQAPAGRFELAFWILAAAALLWPVAAALVKRAGVTGSASYTVPRGATYLDAVVLVMTALTLFVFVISGHPVGAMHMVPMLVALLLVMAGRLAALWHGGRVGGKVLAVGLLACFVLAAAPRQLKDLRWGAMDTARVLDARHYALWLHRAQWVLEHRVKDLPRLDAARHLRSLLPYEHARNSTTNVSVVTSHLVASDNLAKELAAFLEDPPKLAVPYDPGRVVGLVLLNLLARPTTTPATLAGLLQGLPAKNAATALECLGYHLVRVSHELEPTLQGLIKEVRGRPALAAAGMPAIARGVGRASSLGLFNGKGKSMCNHHLLPAAMNDHFIDGLARGLHRQIVRPPPAWVLDNVCEERRARFKAALKAAGPPTEVVLPKVTLLGD